MQYHKLDEYLGKKEDRPYGNNTRVQRRGDNQIAIKHFDTDIMLYTPNTITMNCEGWRSATTKNRLNNNLPSPWMIYQEKGVWYLREGWKNDNSSFVFEDGITIHLTDNTITGMGELSDIKEKHKLARQINKYAAEYVSAFINGDIPAPSNVDCWGCLFKDEKGKTVLGSDHLLSHIEEKYYVPYLLVNAINEFPIAPVATWVIGEKWQEGQKVEFAYDVFERQAKSSIIRYMKRQLKLAT